MAHVAAYGPFSAFPGIDRTLAVVKGSGLVLTIGAGAPVTLACGSDPISFAGDIATSARLIGGEIVDLNVMTRRRRFSHELRRVAQPASCDFDGHDIAVVLSLNGSATLVSERDVATLDHSDAAVAVVDQDAELAVLMQGGPARVLRADQERLPARAVIVEHELLVDVESVRGIGEEVHVAAGLGDR